MENVQALCLLLGALALWLEARRSTDLAPKHALTFGGLGYFTMLLLEFDVRPFGIAWLSALLSGFVRDAGLGGVWVYFLCKAAKQWRQVLYEWLAWGRSVVGILLGLAGILWIVGAFLEDVQALSPGKNLFAEELMETNAALLMLWGAVEIGTGGLLLRSRSARG